MTKENLFKRALNATKSAAWNTAKGAWNVAKNAPANFVGWITGAEHKKLVEAFTTSKQEAIFQEYLASANLDDVNSAIKEFKSIPQDFFTTATKDLASLFPKDKKIPGTQTTFFDALKSKPGEEPEVTGIKNELNTHILGHQDGRQEASIKAKILAPGGAPVKNIPIRDFINTEIINLSEQVKSINNKGSITAQSIDPLARTDFLGNLRSRLNHIRSKALEGIKATHETEAAKLDHLTPEIKNNLAERLGIDADAAVNEVKTALKQAHENELKKFEEAFAKQTNEVEKFLLMEMYRLSILKFIEENGSEDEKAALKNLIDNKSNRPNEPGSIGQVSGTKDHFKDINPQSLGAYNFFSTPMSYDKNTGIHSVALQENLTQQRDAMNLLVKNIRSTSKSDDITLTINMNDPTKAESTARELYLACISHGYDPKNIHITSSGKDMTTKNKEGKVELYNNAPNFSTQVEKAQETYRKQTAGARTSPLTHREDTQSMSDRHREPGVVDPGADPGQNAGPRPR